MRRHVGDGLSALIDGELPGREAAEARQHLDRCLGCREELAAVTAVRDRVRALPPVEPPVAALARIRPRAARPRPLPIGAGLAAAAALVVLGLTVGDASPDVAPDVDAVGLAHDQAASALGMTPATGHRPVSAPAPGPVVDEADLDAPLVAPAVLGGRFRRQAAYRTGDGVQLVYAAGRAGVSVFERPGRVDWDALPAGGDRVTVDGRRIWRSTEADGSQVVVVDGDGVAVMVVSRTPAAAMEVVRALPAPSSASWPERARRAARSAVEGLSFELGLGG